MLGGLDVYILVLSLVCALLIAVFALQNAAAVAIRFFWITTDVPLVLVILGSALGGSLITLLLAVWRQFRRRRLPAPAAGPEPDPAQGTSAGGDFPTSN